MKINNNNFKDAKPEDTVRKIKQILHELHCVTNEKWMSSVSGIFSVRIDIEGTHIGANGKGITRELTLASGYGELIERLQNMINFRMTSVFATYIKQKPNCVCPDQTIRNSVCLNELEKVWMKEVINKSEIEKLNTKLIDFSDGEIIKLPYKNYEFEKTIEVPYILADIFYGSNGMAAGNTKEEAMVQGISEIFERYIVKKIITNNYKNIECFPEITEYVCDKYPWLFDIIKECEINGYKIHILDLSIENNLPVVSTIFIKQKDLKYFVNFGCHPILEVAIERTISELLQGRDIANLKGMTDFEESINSISKRKNKNSIFINGTGIYPYDIFYMTPKKPCDTWYNKFNSNKDILNFYTNIIKNMGKEMYYRDMSFLGFPTFHIIIPGLSEITEDIIEAYRFFDVQNICKILGNIVDIDTNSAKKIVEDLDIVNPESTITLFDIMQLPIPVDIQNPLMDVTIDLLMMMLCAYISDYERGSKYAKRYIDYLDKNKAAIEIKKYYRLILAIFNMKKEKIALSKMKAVLLNFFSIEYIEEVLEDIKPENIFNNFPTLKCPECDKCNLKECCCFIKEKELYKKLIDKANAYYCQFN